MKRKRVALFGSIVLASALAIAPSPARAAGGSFIGPFTTVSTVASTVPLNGDLNPYGVAVVPRTQGRLIQGHVLVSNFNDKANLQGTGHTIVEIAPDGTRTLFALLNPATLPGPCPGGVGLTTALVVLSSGWVIVGSLPTTNGMAATARAGCLLVLDSMGRVAETFSGALINGPWDMTAFDAGSRAVLFVTNVLNGTVEASPRVVNRGTVVRIDLEIPPGGMPRQVLQTVIGSGFGEQTNASALVIGPTGVGLSLDDTLYVADSLNNRIAAIPDALFRTTSAQAGRDVSVNGAISDPLGLALAPNGDILSVNGNNGNLVETTPGGTQIAVKRLDSTGSPPGSGTLFGLAVAPGGSGVYFVDDGTNTLNLLH